MGLDATGFHTSETQTSLLSYRLARKKQKKLVASLDMIHSKKQITKALIRLHGCTGWSAPLLLGNPEDRIFYVSMPIYYCYINRQCIVFPSVCATPIMLIYHMALHLKGIEHHELNSIKH